MAAIFNYNLTLKSAILNNLTFYNMTAIVRYF